MSSETPATTLRDRIRRAICEAEGFAWDSDMLEPDEYGDVADAVLAVLPGTAAAICEIPHATVAEEEACEQRRLEGVEPEAHPPSSRWSVETYDPVAEEWAPGSRYPSRADALERYLGISSSRPMWRDGTPVQRRIVRETTTHTVEPTP